MPKKNIDYSNTVIYKICCKDESIRDVYVGNTTNFIQRKNAHKRDCNNIHNDLKIYKTIRKNGGWDNWNMVEIAKYNCKDSTEARIKEQEHYKSLKSTLNTNNPYCNYYCKICDYTTSRSNDYGKHIKTIKHLKKMNGNILESDLSQNSQISDNSINNNAENGNNFIKKNICQFCNKKYVNRSGLWKHLKICNNTNKKEDSDVNVVFANALLELVKNNSEIQKQMFDFMKTICQPVLSTNIDINNDTLSS